MSHPQPVKTVTQSMLSRVRASIFSAQSRDLKVSRKQCNCSSVPTNFSRAHSILAPHTWRPPGLTRNLQPIETIERKEPGRAATLQEQNGLRHGWALCSTPGLQLGLPAPACRLWQLPGHPVPNLPALDTQPGAPDLGIGQLPWGRLAIASQREIPLPRSSENHLLVWDGCHGGRAKDLRPHPPLPLPLQL